MQPKESWNPEIVEVNYDAGRSMSTYAPFDLNMNDFPETSNVIGLCNLRLVAMRIVQTVRLINKKFDCCIKVHKEILQGKANTILDSPHSVDLVKSPSAIHECKIECESIVFQMRRVLDSLVQLTSFLVDPDRINEDKEVRFDSVGRVIHLGKKAGEVGKIVLGDSFYHEDLTGFIEISNDLFNGFKHSLVNDETFNLVGEEWMTIVGYSVKQSNYNNIVQYHNHNSYHIMMGFEDCVRRILINQKMFLSKK